MRKRWMWLCVFGALACGESDRKVSTVTVSGRAREDALRFAGGVKVEVLYADGTLTGHEATSDSAGQFAVTAPARSEVYFRCTSSGCVPTNSRFFTTGQTALEGIELWVFTLGERSRVASGAAAATGVTADISGRGLVVGILYDQDGYPVTGATVTISTADAETGLAYVDFEGAYGVLPFTIGLLATHQFAAVNVPDSSTTEVFELTQNVDSHKARARSVAGEVTAIILEGLPVYCGVIGAVIDETETGVPDAAVEAYDASGALLAEATSEEEGVFALVGLTEGTDFYVHAEIAAGYLPGNTRYYEIADEPFIGTGVLLMSDGYYDDLLTEMASDLGFTRDDSKALLAARLTDTNEVPLAGEKVTMTPQSGERGYLDSDGSFDDAGFGASGGTVYTDTQNVPTLLQWAAAKVDGGGAVHPIVELGQSLDGSTVRLPCRSGEVTATGLEKLPRRVAISGTVRNEANNPVQNATVSIYGSSPLISATTAASGLFQLTGRILAESRVTLRIERAGYRTTNTSYIDLPDRNLTMGNLFLATDGYFSALVTAIETANAGLTVDLGKGLVAGAVRDLQLPATAGPGKVDGAQVAVEPASGLLDYLNDLSEFGNTETDDQTPGRVMFFAVNVNAGDVTLTEDWDSTSLECPVRAGELTVAGFRRLTPQNTIGGWVYENEKIFSIIQDATVDAYDAEGTLVGTATSDASGVWEIKGLRAFERLYLSCNKVGYVTTNSQYHDIEYSDAGLIQPLFTLTFESQLKAAWEDTYYPPDTSACGVVMGDLMTGVATKLAGLTATLQGSSEEVGYLDATESFGLASTDAGPQLNSEPAPQFHIFDVSPGDYVLEQSGDGKLTTVPVRAGEYTFVSVGGISAPIDMSGTITDGTDPVAGAVVSIPDSPYSTVTAPDGSYTLSNVPARSRITVSVSKDGATINIPYFEAYATASLDLFFLDAALLDLLIMRFEAELGELDSENKAMIVGIVEDAAGPVAGVTVSLSPSAGDTIYFDEYLRGVAPCTQEDSGLQLVIGNIDPGDAVMTQDYNWQRVELPCRAGEWTLGFMGIQN